MQAWTQGEEPCLPLNYFPALPAAGSPACEGWYLAKQMSRKQMNINRATETGPLSVSWGSRGP